MGACVSAADRPMGGTGDVARMQRGGRWLSCNGATCSSCAYSKRGSKSVNQDRMLVWEARSINNETNGQEFTPLKNAIFCGVFDGHGPNGHHVAGRVRDLLPSLLLLMDHSLQLERSQYSETFETDNQCEHEQIGEKNASIQQAFMVQVEGHEPNKQPFTCDIKDPHWFSQHWKDKFIQGYAKMDKTLKSYERLNCVCSGTTAITMLVQDNELVIGNVGDSRAILATRADDGSLIVDQLTTDLKPNLPGELERIQKCQGRVFSLEDEPHVARIWLPHTNTPGLAMARALGDFCLKEYGLSAVPEVSYRLLTEHDEFIVLATDGVWDVLSNDEVASIVASCSSREAASKCVVAVATKRWKHRQAIARVDDCAVVCHFVNSKLHLATPIAVHDEP